MKLKINTRDPRIALSLKLIEFRRRVDSLPAIEVPEYVLEAARAQGWTSNKQKEGYDANREIDSFGGINGDRDRVLGVLL